MTRLNLGSGAHPLDGFENLDAENGWLFEDGLGDYPGGSVEGITISHALMFVALKDWPFVFSEIARVLEPLGVIRITEDATDDPRSERYGGFEGTVTLTTFAGIVAHCRGVDLLAYWMPPEDSTFKDKSLIQRWHGEPPKVFHVEGLKP